MRTTLRLTALSLITAFGVGLAAPMAAQASWKGKRNTAYALGALGVYGIATRKPLIGALGVGGGIYQYLQATKEKRKDEARRRWRRRAYAYRSARRRAVTSRRFSRSRRTAFAPPGWSHGRKMGWHKG